MPLASLATVELQLCMHFCDRASLIALARCSRTTLAAASSDFSWQHLSPMRIRSSTPDLVQKLSSSLLRHVDVCLWWSGDASDRPFSRPDWCLNRLLLSDAEVVTVVSLSQTRLRGLDCSQRSIEADELERLLSLPACAQLTELITSSKVNTRLMQSLPERLPMLRTLSFVAATDAQERAADFASLSQLHHLSELRIIGDIGPLDVPVLGAYRSLHTLALWFSDAVWPALLLSPRLLSSLRSLELRFPAQPESPDLTNSAWANAFAHLQALDTLMIATCWRVNAMLTLVAQHCLSLRTLRLQIHRAVDPVAASADPNSQQPSIATLRSLLSQRPSLQLLLELRSLKSVQVGSPGA